MLQDQGFSRTFAAATLGTMSLMSALGRLILPALTDRGLPVRFAAIIGFALQLAAVIIILVARQEWMIWLFVVIFGLGWGTSITTKSILVANYFGAASMGTLYGTMNLVSNIGFPLGPLAAGLVYDATKSYTPWLMTLIVTFIIGIVLKASCSCFSPDHPCRRSQKWSMWQRLVAQVLRRWRAS